jgi:thiamine biosynthesis lipoprotein
MTHLDGITATDRGDESAQVVTDLSFRALGVDCHIAVDGGPGLAEAARERISGLEACWNRTVPDGEISRMNAATGTMTVLSPDTFLLVARTAAAMEETDGCFDATMPGPPSALADQRVELPPRPVWAVERRATFRGDRRAHPRRAPVHITIFPEQHGALLPAGYAFDPGGIGKGLAADIVVADMLAAGARGVVVEVGSYVRVAGVPFEEACWRVLIGDPFDHEHVIATAKVADGAVATSSTLTRRWNTDDDDNRNVLDPSTRKPARGGLVAVTAVAGTGWWAQALAKAVLVAGLRHGEQIVRRHNASAVAVRNDGRVEILGAPELIEFPAANGH